MEDDVNLLSFTEDLKQKKCFSIFMYTHDVKNIYRNTKLSIYGWQLSLSINYSFKAYNFETLGRVRQSTPNVFMHAIVSRSLMLNSIRQRELDSIVPNTNHRINKTSKGECS